jgi:hypothetical protein
MTNSNRHEALYDDLSEDNQATFVDGSHKKDANVNLIVLQDVVILLSFHRDYP